MTKIKRELLRDTEKAEIAGVCAGVADYFGWEVWLVRIVTVSAFLLGAAGFVFVLYLAGWFVLEEKKSVKGLGQTGFDAPVDKPVEVKTRVWQRGEAPTEALKHLNERFAHLEGRLRDMERHVTSATFQLNRELNKL